MHGFGALALPGWAATGLAGFLACWINPAAGKAGSIQQFSGRVVELRNVDVPPRESDLFTVTLKGALLVKRACLALAGHTLLEFWKAAHIADGFLLCKAYEAIVVS